MSARRILLLLISMSIIFAPMSYSSVEVNVVAQGPRYHVQRQYSTVWINEDGSVDLYYDIIITCDSESLTRVSVYQPGKEFIVGEAFDENGEPLEMSVDAENGAVEVEFVSPLLAGDGMGFNLTTNVPKMVLLDNDNPENVVLSFDPTRWSEAVKELKVQFVLPEGAIMEKVSSAPTHNGTSSDQETGRLMLVWERIDVSPDEKLTFSVSYPKELQENYEIRRVGLGYFLYDLLIPNMPMIVVVTAIIIALILVLRRAFKSGIIKIEKGTTHV